MVDLRLIVDFVDWVIEKFVGLCLLGYDVVVKVWNNLEFMIGFDSLGWEGGVRNEEFLKCVKLIGEVVEEVCKLWIWGSLG